MQLKVFFQLEALVKSLPTNFTYWRNFTSMFSHVIQKVFFFAKDVAADVTFVLDFPGVNWNMLFEAVDAGEFTFAYRTHEESRVVLHC